MVLRSKSHLKKLELWFGESTVEHTNEIEEVFAELFPPPCFEELKIRSYFGRGFPGWMMSASLGSSLPQLTSLSPYNCKNVLKLPPLGLLPELRYLGIRGAETVVTMGPEFLGSGATTSVAFPKLENLYIAFMTNLDEWSFCGEEEGLTVLPHLQKLTIHTCPKLESLPTSLAYLKELVIFDCPMLKSVGKVDALKKLALDNSDIECLPEWLLRLLQQRQQTKEEKQEQQDDDDFQLELYLGDKLFKGCLMGCEYWPIIRNVPFVNTYGDNAYLKYTKKAFSYDTNL